MIEKTSFDSSSVKFTGENLSFFGTQSQERRNFASSVHNSSVSEIETPVAKKQGSSTLRRESGKPTYSITAKRMTSGLVLK
jgi:hypothetical protein